MAEGGVKIAVGRLPADTSQVNGYIPAALKVRIVNLRRYDPHLSVSRVVEEALMEYVPYLEQELVRGTMQQRRRYQKPLRAASVEPAQAEPEAEPTRRARPRTTVWDHDPI